MSLPNEWSDWWRGFLGFSRDGRYKAIEILLQQYVEANRRASQLRRHAQDMAYPQFREKLLSIAADESRHGDQIAEKIKLLGAPLPAVPETQFAGGNSWQSLLADLEEQRRSAAELWEQLRRVRPEFPEIAEVLQRVYENGKKHRSEITDMLMRSDPQAFSAS